MFDCKTKREQEFQALHTYTIYSVNNAVNSKDRPMQQVRV